MLFRLSSCWCGGLTYFSQEMSYLWVSLLLSLPTKFKILPVVFFFVLQLRWGLKYQRVFISILSHPSVFNHPCMSDPHGGSSQAPSLLREAEISCHYSVLGSWWGQKGPLLSWSNLSLNLSLNCVWISGLRLSQHPAHPSRPESLCLYLSLIWGGREFVITAPVEADLYLVLV